MYIEWFAIIGIGALCYIIGRRNGHDKGFMEMSERMEQMIETGQLVDNRAGYDEYLEETKDNWNF